MCRYEVKRCFSCDNYGYSELKTCNLRNDINRSCASLPGLTFDGNVIQDDVDGGCIWPFNTINTPAGHLTTFCMHPVQEVIGLCGDCESRCLQTHNGNCKVNAYCTSGGREVFGGYIYDLSFEPDRVLWSHRGRQLNVRPARKFMGRLRRTTPWAELTLLLEEKMTKKERNNTFKMVTDTARYWLESADCRRRDAFAKGVPFPFRQSEAPTRSQSAPSLAVPMNGPTVNGMQESAGSLSSSASSAVPMLEGQIDYSPFFVSPEVSNLSDGYHVPVPGAQAEDNGGTYFTPRSSVDSLTAQESANSTGNTAGLRQRADYPTARLMAQAVDADNPDGKGASADISGKGEGKRKRGSVTPVEESTRAKSARTDMQGGLQTFGTPGAGQPVNTMGVQWAGNNTVATPAAWNQGAATRLLNSGAGLSMSTAPASWSSGAATTFPNTGAGSMQSMYPSGSVVPGYGAASQLSATAALGFDVSEFVNLEGNAEGTDALDTGAQSRAEDSGIAAQDQQEGTNSLAYPDPDASSQNVIASAGPSTFANPGAHQRISSTGPAFISAWQGSHDGFAANFNGRVGNGYSFTGVHSAAASHGVLANAGTADAGHYPVLPSPDVDEEGFPVYPNTFNDDFTLFPGSGPAGA